ncbi:MAG: hypothetical protein IPP22_09210 [Nitrosomonas sp.]|nr:hypothetical protein [Nitrosomonas sp.]
MTQPYGSFIQNPPPAFDQHSKVMADDVADQIGRLYPAATTQFDLRHNANDPFGQALIDKLRSDGFAVLENTSPANSFSRDSCTRRHRECQQYRSVGSSSITVWHSVTSSTNRVICIMSAS